MVARSFLVYVVVVALGFGLETADAQRGAYVVPDETPANIKRAVQSSNRSDQHRERDYLRRPAEILSLLEIKEDDRVIEFASFGNYYTTLLAEAVGPGGFVYMVDMPWTEPFGGSGSRAFDAAHDNASYTISHFNRTDLPENVDAATMVLFYHDLQVQSGEQRVDPVEMNARIFEALRPGGRYLVIDHKAKDYADWRDVEGLHRIDEATIVREVTSVGFELIASSNVLANPEDDHQLSMRDPSIRGRTDKAVLVFQKPER